MTEPEHLAAARAVYDATAEEYAQSVGTEVSATFEGPIDRAVLAAFVELVSQSALGSVVDVGCGPGRVAAFLATRGVDVVGVDPSPAMLAVARAAHPRIRFDDGALDTLPFPNRSLVGAVCWYSIIHTPPEHLGRGFAELERVLVPGGHLLVAFQGGDGRSVVRPDAYGTGLTLTSYRHSAADVAAHLTASGFDVRTTIVREAELDHESTPQVFILARTAPDRRRDS